MCESVEEVVKTRLRTLTQPLTSCPNSSLFLQFCRSIKYILGQVVVQAFKKWNITFLINPSLVTTE